MFVDCEGEQAASAVVEEDYVRSSLGSPTGLRYLVLALQREGWRQLAQRLRGLGISPAQAEIVSVLADRGPLTLAELGRRIICETGSPSRVVTGLVNSGTVVREESSLDRRTVQLRLSEKGRALLREIKTVDSELDGFIDQCLTSQERAAVAEILQRLLDNTTTGTKLALRFEPARSAAPLEAVNA